MNLINMDQLFANTANDHLLLYALFALKHFFIKAEDRIEIHQKSCNSEHPY